MQKLLDAVDDQAPIRKAGQGIMARLEGNLFLMDHERLMQVLAFNFERFGHAHDGHMQASLEHREGLGQNVIETQSSGVTAQLTSDGVVPTQATFRDLVQRGVVAGRQLPKDARGVETFTTSIVFVTTRKPERECSGGGSGDRSDER